MKRTISLFLFLSLLLAACTAAPQATATPAATPGGEGTSIAPTGSLDGTRWVLTSMTRDGADAPPVSGSNVTLNFEANGQVGGNAGCNSYGGSYETRGSNITFLNVVSTLMACADQAVTDQESAYLNALNLAATYQLASDNLTITTNDGGQLKFTRAQ